MKKRHKTNLTVVETIPQPEIALVNALPPESCGIVENLDYLNFRVCACLVWDIEGADSKETAFTAAHQRLQQILDQAGLSDQVATRLQLNRLKPPKRNQRIAVYEPDDILQYVTPKKNSYREFVVNGISYIVSMASYRYQLLINNRSCCACGIVGTKMALELHQQDKLDEHNQSQKAYFSLYAEENGHMVLMTKDHIKPRARGGPNRMDNYQVMCDICNNLKADADLTPTEVNELRLIYNKFHTTLSRAMLYDKLGKEKHRLLEMHKQNDLNEQPVLANIC